MIRTEFWDGAYSPHHVSSRSLHSKRFSRFPVSKISVSPLQPSVSPDSIQIEMEHLRHKILLYIKFH